MEGLSRSLRQPGYGARTPSVGPASWPRPAPAFPEGSSPTGGPGDTHPRTPGMLWVGGRAGRPAAPGAPTLSLLRAPERPRSGRGEAQGLLGALPSPLAPPPAPRLPDLLLPLLFAFGTAAPLRAGETRPRVHALLHVPRHALLQRQGGHLTRCPKLARAPKDAREEVPRRRPSATGGSSPHFIQLPPSPLPGLQAALTSRTSRTSAPPALASTPVGTPGQPQGPTGGQLQPVGGPGGARRLPGQDGLSSRPSACPPALLRCGLEAEPWQKVRPARGKWGWCLSSGQPRPLGLSLGDGGHLWGPAGWGGPGAPQGFPTRWPNQKD